MNKGRLLFILEHIIIIFIAISVVVFNYLGEVRYDKLDENAASGLFVDGNAAPESDEIIVDDMMAYHQGYHKLVEIYDEDLKLLFSVNLNSSDSDNEYEEKHLADYPNLMKLVNTKSHGEVFKLIDGNRKAIHFHWTTSRLGKRRLVLIYSYIPFGGHFWLYHIMPFFIMILILILMIMNYLNRYKDNLIQYKHNSDFIDHNIN